MIMSTGRRQFLRGAGGIALAIPLLRSLIDPRDARADAGVPAKRFVQFTTYHGGVWGTNMYPADAALTDSMSYAGRTVKRGPLVTQPGPADTAQLSSVLSGPSSLLTPQLAAKMNVIRGCDIPFYIAHHTGGHLGNFARNDGNAFAAFATPTIDQLMGGSSQFYTDLSTNKLRNIVIGTRLSYNWEDPTNPNHGAIQEVAQGGDPLTIFKQLLVTGSDTPVADPRVPIVDHVLADYTRLRNSSTRLSADDRTRLDDHMQRISELQRKLKVHASCPTVKAPTDISKIRQSDAYAGDPVLQAQAYQAYNDVIVAAFLCDTSRIATMNVVDDFSTQYPVTWHGDVAHHAADPDGEKQKILATAHQLTFEKVFLDLCSKLDIDDGSGTGKTYLDNSLVVWTQESGEYTHAGQAMPIIAAGSAGGYLSTGNYCDYRNPALVVDNGEQGNTTVKIFAGLLWQQWLGTVLQAMGLTPSDYEQNGRGGYPTADKYLGPESNYQGCYPDAVWKVAGEVLPFLKA